MKRTIVVLLLTCLTLTSSCAFIFTKGPPPGHEQMTFFLCDEESRAASGDVIMAAITVAGIIPPVVYGLSAYTGWRRARACTVAKRNLALAFQRVMETPESLRADASIMAVIIAQDADTLRVGGSAQLRASAVAGSGATIVGRMFLWGSSNDAIASVDADGVVSAKATGSVTIKASTGGVVASKNVVVLPQP